MGEATPDDMWTPFKQLFSVIESFLQTPGQEHNVANLSIVLRKHKQNFTTLLKNPPKNAKNREEIKRGITEGITLPGLGHTILSKDLVDESMIISDMFDLNEYIALELLCTAQQQMPHHPGLPRGLVAILLYYDGRKCLVASLKELFQARAGSSWCTDTPYEITQIITSYTDALVADGILEKIIDLLENLDISKEMETLTTNRALGPPKHHRQVLDLFNEIRVLLANTLFNWSAQCGLPRSTTVKLIQFLSKFKSTEAREQIDDATLALQMALLYALDLSVIHRREDGEEVVKNLPIIKDSDFVEIIVDTLSGNWECEGLKSLTLFAFGLAIATLRLVPQSLYPNISKIIEHDDILVDAAIQGKVFDFINYTFFENKTIFSSEFYYRRIHVLFTDFIELMHSKVTELRARADETARTVQAYTQQGLDAPPNLCHNFENLLLAVGKFYSNDILCLNLSLEYWGPMEASSTYQRATARSVCLFKFIRLAGELLPPILFIPYLKMLAGLSSCTQSARNAFNLLKQGCGVSGSATVSWDHFFSSLARYYTNLRQEQHPGTETIYRNRVLSRNINPQEIAGLQAVLQVIQAVAKHDEVARVALCEHPTWAPLHVLLGLISCSIVIPLKADLFRTLAALGKSKETALQLWSILEQSQIITTIPSTNTHPVRGIQSEIEEIESRNESYMLTQAVLEFFYTISATAIPRNLGAGPRKPGFDPYLTFIIDVVFLRFYNRNYKDPSEKWVIAEKCLKILDMFIKNYEISASDFPVSGRPKDENSPPGFHIMLQMNTNSEFLRLILHIIDESCTYLDTYAMFPGKKNLENCILYCFNIIERSLQMQESFFDAHFLSNTSILLFGINKLLMDINPRSGKTDHMLNITKFVTYNNWLPKHTLSAVRILTMILRQSNKNAQILEIFTQSEKIKNEIRQGFVECLENQVGFVDYGVDEYMSSEEEDENNFTELNIKEAILNLIQESLSHSGPNVAHFLLGFDITKDIRFTNLQQPGIMDFPSTCTKSLVTLLDQALVYSKSNQSVGAKQEQLIESAYSLLYSLCANLQTSEIILRFLRSCNDFLCRHIACLPFSNIKSSRVINQMSGLLKCVSIELKMTSDKNQLTQFGNMFKILLGIVQNPQQNENTSFELNHYYSNNVSMLNENENTHNGGNKKSGDSKLLISELLECLDFEIKSLDKPKLDYFDNARMQELLHECEIQTTNSLKLVDIKKLHKILKEELNSVQTSIASGQRAHILQEIKSFIFYVLQLNSQKCVSASTVKFMEAWSQVTEILFSVTPPMLISLDVKQGLILEILQAILIKVVPAQIMPELANVASSSVLLLLVNLRHCYSIKNSSNTGASDNQLQLLNLSNTLSSPNNQNGTQYNPSVYTAKTNTLSFKYILKNMIDWIIISGVATQKLRINLYASLLNYMHIIKGNDKAPDMDGSNVSEFFVSRLDKSVGNTKIIEEFNQIDMAVEVFKSFGDKLIDILCHDSIGGHDVCKMLALSCIDMLLNMDSMTNFIQFISIRGYLSHLIDSLIKTDPKLCRVLDNNPENLKALYVYESKMAMLSRFASSHMGAELLLEQKTLSILAQMKVYNLHPDFQVANHNAQYPESSFVPPIAIRYQQILFPALNLCDVVLSTLGADNNSAIRQILHFLISHGDMIEMVLRAGTPFLSLGLLQELSAITSLIARASNQEIANSIDSNANQDVGAHLYRLQKLMLTLFPRFIISEQQMKEIGRLYSENTNNESNISQHIKYILQIASNLALYARNSIANHTVDHRTMNILFSPNINEGIHRNDNRSGTFETSPSLIIVVRQLTNCVLYHNRVKFTYDNYVRKRNLLPNLSLNVNVQAQYNNLCDRILEKQNELKLCVFVTEHCLYLLWAHLDFFMLRAIPVNTLQFNNNFPTFNNDVSLANNSENGWKITSEDISVLKKTLVAVFNETFSKQLLNTTQDQSASDKGFVEALLRRIKRLIQFVPVN